MKAVQGWKPLENGFVRVTVKNMLDGKLIDAELPITPSQILYALNSNFYIQDTLPMLSAGQRELLLTGIPEDEFDILFNEEEG